VPQTSKNDKKDSSALSRTERKKQERTQKLLRTAAEVFAEKGYDNTSLEDIAEKMDMRAPSLYHYVKTKEELYPNHIPLFVRVTSHEPTLKKYIVRVRKEHFKLFADVAQEAATIGQIEQQQWALGLRLVFGSLGSLHQWYRPDGDMPPEDMAKDITKLLLRLVSPQPM